MVWLLWRQHRTQALVTVGLLGALGVFLAVRGQAAAPIMDWLPAWPILVGMFWGAPLVAREMERGTQRLAFTQSVSRRRWLLAKVGGLGAAVLLAGLAVGVMVSHWASSVGDDRFANETLFTGTGVVAGAWWLFAFMLGTATGSVVRRVLPALAVTVALFVVMLVGVFQARDTYAEPLRQMNNAPAGALPAGGTYLSPSGTEVDDPPECTNAPDEKYYACLDAAGYRSVVFFQPADRYWRFQWTETAILLLGTAVLTVPVAYRILRRPV